MGLCFAPSAWNIWEPLEIYFLMVWDDERTPGDQWWWWCVKCTCMHACVSARVYLCVYVCVHGTWLDSHPGALVCVPLETSGGRRKDSFPPTWHPNLSTPNWSPAVSWIELGKRVWLNPLTTMYFLFFRSFPANFFPKGRKCSKDHPCWSKWVQDTSIF